MKLDLAHNFLETSQPFETTEFSIDDSAHAFELLLKNLYSDPISSTVRETISNAWDSHMAAGKADTAIIVTAPTELEPTFIVQDFGVGISPDKFRKVVTRIFCSDKTNSDDMIGGYGLGLKSPLAYTDQFVITSIIDGWLRNYSCHISESGKPMLSTFNKEATSEGNGVTIKVPVKPKDIKAFQTAIKNTLMYFASFTCNLNIAQNSVLWDNDDVQIVNTHNDYGNKLYALVGCIPYEINLSHIVDSPRSEYQWIGSIILKFNINEISVTPNREELNYNEKTINAINKKYNQAKAAAVKDLSDKINACATYELACKHYTRLFTTMERFNWVNDRLVSHPSKPGQGLSKFITVVFDGYEIKTLKRLSRRTGYKTAFDNHFKEKLNVDITKKLTLYWLPKKAKRVLDCLNETDIDFYNNPEHIFIIGDDPQIALKQFQELYNNPVELKDLRTTAKGLTPKTSKTSYRTGNILTSKNPIAIKDISPRDVYIRAVDKTPIGPWTDYSIHVALNVLPDDIRYIIYNHKTHEKMLRDLAIRDFEGLAKQIPILIENNMEAIQRHKQLNTKMTWYVNYINSTQVDYNSKLILFAKTYTASDYVKNLYELAQVLNIDIPDNPAITKELDTTYKMYQDFFDQGIDTRNCPKILTAYDKYLELTA